MHCGFMQQLLPDSTCTVYLSWCPCKSQAANVSGDVVGVVMGHSNGTRVAVDNTLVIKLQHAIHSQC